LLPLPGVVPAPLHAQPAPSATAAPASVQHVFDQLVKAIGDPSPSPRLEITSAIASELPDIILASGWYAWIATSSRSAAPSALTPSNALAAVLGHELAHCFRGFRAARDFGNDVYINWEHSVTRQQIVTEETEADMFSGFYSHIAGYDAISITRPSSKKYTSDSISVTNCRDISRRMTVRRFAVRDGDRLRKLAAMFDMGTFLTLAREYPEAQRCYDQVITQFPSREAVEQCRRCIRRSRRSR